jgi:hypothetical protein
MLRWVSLKWLFTITWVIGFLGLHAAYLYRGLPLEDWTVEFRVMVPGAAGVAMVVVGIVKRLQEEPTKEELAALKAIFQAGPGTLGAVVVTRNGVPEVVATVRSREEYLALAASGRIPVDHFVFLPTDA